MPAVAAEKKRNVLGETGNTMQLIGKEADDLKPNEMKISTTENAHLADVSAVRTKYSGEFLKLVLEIVHHAQDDLDSLIDEVSDELKDNIYEKDVVRLKKKDSNETYVVTYAAKRGGTRLLRLKGPDGTENPQLINQHEVVPLSPRTPDDYRRIILSVAEYCGQIWIGDQQLVRDLHVSAKIHELFLKKLMKAKSAYENGSGSAKTGSPSSDENADSENAAEESSEDEKPLAEIVRRSIGMAPTRKSAAGLAPIIPKTKVDQKKAKKEAVKAQRTAEKEKAKEEKLNARKEKLEAKQKEKEKKQTAKEAKNANSQKGAINKFVVAGTLGSGGAGSPFMSPAKRAEKKFEVTLSKLRKEFNAGNRDGFYGQVSLAAKNLKEEQIEKIPEDLIQFCVRRAFDKEKEREALKGLSTEAKAAFREKKDKEKGEDRKKELKMLAAVKTHFEETSQREDLFVCASRLPLAGEIVQGGKVFADALMLTQAIQSLSKFLDHNLKIGAENLIDSMGRGRSGYIRGIGHILETLLGILQLDPDFKFLHCGQRLRHFTMDRQAVSEMCRAVLIGETDKKKHSETVGAVVDGGTGESQASQPEEGMEEEREMDESFDAAERSIWETNHCSTLLERFSADKEFFELSIEDQMAVALYILQLVLDSQLYADYLQGGATDKEQELTAKIDKEKEKLGEIEKELDEIPAIPEDVDEATMSRIESRMLEKNRQRKNELDKKAQLCKDVVEHTTEGLEVERSCRKNAVRMTPLGMDRHFRRYWFFGKYSINRGLWVQDLGTTREEHLLKEAERQSTQSVESLEMNGEEKENLDDDQSKTLEQWACVREISEVDRLMKSLNEVGTREKLLKQALIKLKPLMAEQKAIVTKERSATPSDEFAESLLAVREAVRTFAFELNEKRMSSMKNADEFEARVVCTEELTSLGSLVVELVESIPSTAIQQRIVSTSAAFTLEKWTPLVHAARNCSHLFMLLDMVQSRVDWGASVNNKRCKKCGKRSSSDEKVLCKKCGTCYHVFCLRPKLKEMPVGDWWCADCDEAQPATSAKSMRSQKVVDYQEDEEDDEYGAHDDFFAARRKSLRKRPIVLDSDFEDDVEEGVRTRGAKRGKVTEEEDPVQQECFRIFSRLKGTRIFNSFQNVPVPRSSRNSRVEVSSIKDIEERIEAGGFRSVDEFKKKLRAFLDVAKKHFEDMERKVEQIVSLEEILDEEE